MRSAFVLAVAALPVLLFAVDACVGDDPQATPSQPADSGAGADGATVSDGAQTGPDGGGTCAPLNDCSGTCVDLNTSSDHCGACGRSCLGSTCTKGACAPVKLVGGLTSPSAIALIASPPLVVVAADTALYSCAKSGCTTAERRWTANTFAPRGELASIAVSDSTAYVVTDSDGGGVRVSRVQLTNNPSTTPNPLSTTAVGTTSRSLAIEGNRIVVGTGPSIRTCLTTGCTYETVQSGLYLGSATLTGGDAGVYVWGGGPFGIDGVSTCPRSSTLPCTAQPLVARAKSGSADFLQVVGGTAYWVDAAEAKQRVLACKVTGCNGEPTVIAANEEAIGGLVVDGKAAYFTTTLANTIRVCRDLTAGCGATATTLVDGQTKPVGIAADETALYWVNQGSTPGTGEIMKLAK